MKISQHFDDSEFACKCGCGQCKIEPELLFVLERVRVKFGKPVTVTSANRCESHNKRVGGSPRSKHLLGVAADIRVKSIPANEVYNYLDRLYQDKYGLGQYDNFTHVDVRPNRARW